MTKRELIDDIELRIYKGKPSDDSVLNKAQISHWIDITGNLLVFDKVNSSISNRKKIDSTYIISENLTLSRDPIQAFDEECYNGRYFMTTSRKIMQLPMDKGVVRVVDQYGRSLINSDQNRSEWLKKLPYGKSSTSNQSFYREGNNIIVDVSDDDTSAFYNYTVYYIPENIFENISLDDDLPLESNLVLVLLENVEEIARNQMGMGIADLDNDGNDPYHDN